MPFWFAFKTLTLNMYFKSSLKDLKQSIILQNCFSLGYSLFSRILLFCFGFSDHFLVLFSADAGFSLIVRDCVVDNGGTTSETEIGRQSHCGWMKVIKYNGRRMSGCILSCGQDGCNTANRTLQTFTFVLTIAFMITKALI